MSLEIKDTAVINSIIHLNMPFLKSNNFNASELNHTSSLGKMTGMQWTFDGIKIIYSETVYNDLVDLAWRIDEGLINMNFNLHGKIGFTHTDTQKRYELASNEHNIFYGNGSEGKVKVEELQTKSFDIYFTKDSFFKIAFNGNDALKRFAENIDQGKSIAFAEYNIAIDPAIMNCISALLSCPYSDTLKPLFFLSKSMELLVLQAEAFNKVANNSGTIVKTKYDREQLIFARDYLLKYIDCPPTLTELARIAGINEFKLKVGFKEFFGTTVFNYLSETRLERARIELLESRRPINEIAYNLGYSSPQHFSNAFKKRYGITPRTLKL